MEVKQHSEAGSYIHRHGKQKSEHNIFKITHFFSPQLDNFRLSDTNSNRQMIYNLLDKDVLTSSMRSQNEARYIATVLNV